MNNVMEFTFTVYKMVGGWWTVKFSVKTIRRMAQIFVALSEKLKFNNTNQFNEFFSLIFVGFLQ